MVANGDASKPIWISEMNSNAVPNDPQIQGVGAYGQVTLEQQARYAQLAYQRIMEEWPWLGVANFWFFKRASDAEREQSWYYFRMVEPDFTPLPVYGAMKTFSSELTPTLYPGLHQEGHWALSYEGDWRDVDDEHAMFGVLRRSTEAGALLRFTMEGARLALVAAGDEAQIEVRVADAAASPSIRARLRPSRFCVHCAPNVVSSPFACCRAPWKSMACRFVTPGDRQLGWCSLWSRSPWWLPWARSCAPLTPQ
jgi:hypothetical protein